MIYDFRWYRVRLRLAPTVDDLFRFALKSEAVNLPRRGETANYDRNVVLPSLRINHIGKHKRAALFFRKAAKLPTHQRHQLRVFIDLLVDLDEQSCLIQRRDMLSQIFEVTHGR